MPVVDGVNIPNNPQNGAWYQGRQYWNGTLSAPGVINSQSNQVGAGQAVSAEVNAQSAAAQGVSTQDFNKYLQDQTQKYNSANQASGANSAVSAVPAGIVSPANGSGVVGGVPAGVPGTSSINLPDLYKSLTESTGVKAKQDQLSQYEKAFADAQSKINDNPFLSEASRVGRVQKLQTDFNQNTAGIRNDIATAKADVETQLNLQTKQLDINSQQTKDALDYFDRLLSSGALNNASNEDIANLTRATGLSSGVIQSAIQNNKQAGLKTSTTSFDDGTNEGILIYSVDPQGNVVSQQRLVTGKSSKAGANNEDAAFNRFINMYGANTSGGSSQDSSTGFSNVDALLNAGKTDQALNLFYNP